MKFVLLACAVPPIAEKCGPEAVQFVEEYVRRFATVIDPQCKMGENGQKATGKKLDTEYLILFFHFS